MLLLRLIPAEVRRLQGRDASQTQADGLQRSPLSALGGALLSAWLQRCTAELPPCSSPPAAVGT